MKDNWIGQRVTALRIRKNISERELGEKIGRSDSYINKVANGRVIPPIEALEQICTALDSNLQEFFTGSQNLSDTQYAVLTEIVDLDDADTQFVLTTIRHLRQRNSASKRRRK